MTVNNLRECRQDTQSVREAAISIHLNLSQGFSQRCCLGVVNVEAGEQNTRRMGCLRGARGTPIPIPYIDVKLAASHADNHLFHLTIALERFCDTPAPTGS